jgi:tRNA(fMet)-specific endonuclease VapC
MSLYVLDTDVLTLYRYGHSLVVNRVDTQAANAVAIMVLSVEEQVRGWYASLRQSKHQTQMAFAYNKLAETVRFLGQWHILPFTVSAMNRFKQLRAQKLNIGAMDLKIAAVTLDHGGILVTRNQRDFQRVPNLTLEDWTV